MRLGEDFRLGKPWSISHRSLSPPMLADLVDHALLEQSRTSIHARDFGADNNLQDCLGSANLRRIMNPIDTLGLDLDNLHMRGPLIYSCVAVV